MIRVRLINPADRRAFAMFLTFSNLVVQDNGVDTLLVDFADFDLEQQAQLRVVDKMLSAWRIEHRHAATAESVDCEPA